MKSLDHIQPTTPRAIAVVAGICLATSVASMFGCASASSPKSASERAGDVAPLIDSVGNSARDSGHEPALLPWIDGSRQGPTRVVPDGLSLSFDVFASLDAPVDDLLSKGSSFARFIRPQEWAQAGAPPLSALVLSSTSERVEPEAAFSLVRSVEAIRLPSGRTFLSISVAVIAPRLEAELLLDKDAPMRLLLSDPRAAADLRLETLDVSVQDHFVQKNAAALPGERLLLVTSGAPSFAVSSWRRSVANERRRGIAVSLWFRPRHLLPQEVARAADRLRTLVVEGNGQAWIGGEPDTVLENWRSRRGGASNVSLRHPSVTLEFDRDVVQRHRVIGASVVKTDSDPEVRWRSSQVYSFVVELGTNRRNLDGTLGMGSLVFDIPVVDGPASGGTHGARQTLRFMFALTPDDVEVVGVDGTLASTSVARQVALVLAAERFHGRHVDKGDAAAFNRLKFESGASLTPRLRALLLANIEEGEAQP